MMELRMIGLRKDAKYRNARKDLRNRVKSFPSANLCVSADLCVFARNLTLNPI